MSNQQSLFSKGFEHHQKDQLNDAVECYKQALEFEEDKFKVYLNLGTAYSKKKDYTSAL